MRKTGDVNLWPPHASTHLRYTCKLSGTRLFTRAPYTEKKRKEKKNREKEKKKKSKDFEFGKAIKNQVREWSPGVQALLQKLRGSEAQAPTVSR